MSNIKNKVINSQNTDLRKWKKVLIDNLPDKDKELFITRKKAVELYIIGEKTTNEIVEITGLHRNEIVRLVERCLYTDENGCIYGFTALIPYKRVVNYNRTSIKDSNKYTGAFSLLLEEHPDIQRKIIDLYLNRSKEKIKEKSKKISYIYKEFLKACRKKGIVENEYPFNTDDKGRRSFYRYIKEIDNKYDSESIKRKGNEVARHYNSTGIGTRSNPEIIRPFERVEFDGHKIDAIFSITYRTLEGDEITETLSRLWLLVVIDVATRVILGYHICLNREYSSYDVLQCIKSSIFPKEKIDFSISGLKYPDGGGYASLKIPETKWALWNEFCYDNAKANLALIVREKLTQVVGCSVNAGPVKMPERRSFVERFFRSLEEYGYHRLVNTTGSNPKDPKRDNPEKKAVEYKISTKHLKEITEVLIANYNETPHNGLYGFTPLEIMEQRINRGLVPRTMAVEQQEDIVFLSLRDKRTIKGDKKAGKRPFIFYEGVQYRNDVLSRSPDLIGTKLTLLVNIDDLRVIKAFLPDGSEFGLLTAVGKWGIRSHSLQLRKIINKLKRDKKIHFNNNDDPIEIYHNYLVKNSKENKSNRNRLATLESKLEQSSDSVKNAEIKNKKSYSKKINEQSKDNSDTIQRLKKFKSFKTSNH
ncbi:MAG: hypothetical protein N4A62_05225 [Marinisporobacter sp.]|nr:hypothetical protein [Marinisporobacter sp.]